MYKMDVDPELRLAMTLRDSQLIDVIVAVDRLVLTPKTEEQLDLAKQDLSRLKSFFNERVSPELLNPASDIFVEHVQQIMTNFPKGKEDVHV